MATSAQDVYRFKTKNNEYYVHLVFGPAMSGEKEKLLIGYRPTMLIEHRILKIDEVRNSQGVTITYVTPEGYRVSFWRAPYSTESKTLFFIPAGVVFELFGYK